MPDIPAEAFEAAAKAIREGLRLRLGPNALAAACDGHPIRLSGCEADEAARLAVAAAAPLLAAQAGQSRESAEVHEEWVLDG